MTYFRTQIYIIIIKLNTILTCIKVSVNISEVKLTLTEKQYGLAIAIIRDNIIVASQYANSEANYEILSNDENENSLVVAKSRRNSIQPSNV